MSLLPDGFAALEPFIEGWALGSSAKRAARRNHSTAEERQAFYDAGAPLLTPALDLLDRKAFADYSAAEQRLIDLCLMLAHVAMAVEALGSDEAVHAPARAAMVITRAPADC
jgi:hypothetical protein